MTGPGGPPDYVDVFPGGGVMNNDVDSNDGVGLPGAGDSSGEGESPQ